MQQQLTELKIEDQIIKAMQNFQEKIFNNKNRFEMILSQPNQSIEFQQIKGTYKGRFTCQNNKCLQQKRDRPSKNLKVIKRNEQKKSQGLRFEQASIKSKIKETNRFIPEVSFIDEIDNQKQPNNKVTPEIKIEQCQGPKKIKYREKLPQDQIPEGFQNTKWSSTLAHVILYYKSYPLPLKKLKSYYQKNRKNKIQIFFYVEILGQNCEKCLSNQYCYPSFGGTQLKRMTQNFTETIRCQIMNYRYGERKLGLKNLQGHKSSLCEACQEGKCAYENA